MNDIDKINEELQSLTEASDFKFEKTTLKSFEEETGIDLCASQFSRDSEEWNKTYASLLSNEIIDKRYYVIRALNFWKDNKEASGFIQVSSNTKDKVRKITRKVVSKISADNVTITDNEEEASIFEEDTINNFIRAIERNRAYKTRRTKFEKTLYTGYRIPNNPSFLRAAYWYLFSQESKNHLNPSDDVYSGPNEFISQDLDYMMDKICQNEKKPLTGNVLWYYIKRAYDFFDKTDYKVTGHSIRIVNNLFYDGRLYRSDIEKLKTFRGNLVFNSTLFQQEEDNIGKIFDAYDKARSKPFSKFKGMDASNIAKNLILKPKEDGVEDIFKQMVESEDISTLELPEIKFDMEDICKNHIVRNYGEIESFLTHLNENKDTPEDEEYDDYKFYIQLTTGQNVDSVIESNSILEKNEDDISVKFNSVKCKKGQFPRLVRTKEEHNENISLPNIFDSFWKAHKDEFNEYLDKDNKFIKDFNLSMLLELSKIQSAYKINKLTITKLSEDDISKSEDESEKSTESGEESETGEVKVENDVNKPESNPEAKLDEIPENMWQYLDEIEPSDGTIDGDTIRGVTIKRGDVVKGFDGNYYIATSKNLPEDGKWDIPAGTKILRIKPSVVKELSDLGFSIIPHMRHGIK